MTLARLGNRRFHIADLDVFEIENFNRQYGARVSTLGREKAHVLAETARDINPGVELTVFGAGVSEDNVAEFLDGVDLYVDGLDFFAVAARRAACARRGVPAITAAPLGMGAAVLNFLPGGMTFDEYFGLVQRFTLAVARERLALERPRPIEPVGDVPRTLDLARRRCLRPARARQPTRVGSAAGDHRHRATAFGMTTRVSRRDDAFDIKLQHSAVDPSPLLGAIRLRSVQRGRMPTTALTPRQRDALAAAVAPFSLCWLDRTRAARLNFRNALLRLGLPEAFDTHASAIEWHADRSETRLPDRALGVNPVTARIMRWALGSRDRARWLAGAGGSLGPAAEMDLLPGLACATHFALVAPAPLFSVDDFVAAGRVVQRFWLTATAVMSPRLQKSLRAIGIHFTLLTGLVNHHGQRALYALRPQRTLTELLPAYRECPE